MAEKCPRCEDKIRNGESYVECPNCKQRYHTWCWGFMKTCKNCGYENPNNLYNEEARNHQEKNQQDINLQSSPEGTEQPIKAYVTLNDNYVKGNVNSHINYEETGMFANVGEKLKTWAKVTAVFGVISGIITVIAMLIIDEYMLLAGVVAGVIEVVSAWAMALILYAFGELVANSKESKNIQQQILDELRSKDQNKEQ